MIRWCSLSLSIEVVARTACPDGGFVSERLRGDVTQKGIALGGEMRTHGVGTIEN